MIFMQLCGCWRMAKAAEGIDAGSAVEMEFEPSGRLIYGVLDGDKWQVMLLTYCVEGNAIVSDQPSSRREERTRFEITESGDLVLNWSGKPTCFVRIPIRSFRIPDNQ